MLQGQIRSLAHPSIFAPRARERHARAVSPPGTLIDLGLPLKVERWKDC